MTAYRIIEAEKAEHAVPVSVACELLEVSRSGYYEWATRPPSDRALTDAFLIEKIKAIHRENRGVYGSPRIHAELRIEHGIGVGRKRVERLMVAAGISGLQVRKRGRTTVRVQGVRVADDLVKRQFRPQQPNLLWLADFSYLPTWEGWLLPRRRAGRVLATDRRLVHGRSHARGAGHRRAEDGRQAPQTAAGGDSSFRSGRAGRIQSVVATLAC